VADTNSPHSTVNLWVMERLIKILTLIFACALLFSCATPNSIMHSWIGHTEYELYQRWGKPEKIIDNGRDGRIAVYIPAADLRVDKKNAYCDSKFKTDCILPKLKEYKNRKVFYITPLGNIYACEQEALGK
jgi:hypothetical protein